MKAVACKYYDASAAQLTKKHSGFDLKAYINWLVPAGVAILGFRVTLEPFFVWFFSEEKVGSDVLSKNVKFDK